MVILFFLGAEKIWNIDKLLIQWKALHLFTKVILMEF